MAALMARVNIGLDHVPRQYISEIRLKHEEISSFSRYPFSLPAVRHLDVLQLHPAVTFFVGENGSGKSTLLEAIAVSFGFNAEGGSKDFNFGTRESHSELYKFLRIAKGVPRPTDGFFLRAESFYNVATMVEDLGVGASYGDRSLHEQSHGESFIALMVNRFRGEGLYLLDEPEAALSPSRQLSVITRIHDLVQQKSQFIIATHPRSSWLIQRPTFTLFQRPASNASPIRKPSISESPATSLRTPTHAPTSNVARLSYATG
jgi:predicted ATPase